MLTEKQKKAFEEAVGKAMSAVRTGYNGCSLDTYDFEYSDEATMLDVYVYTDDGEYGMSGGFYVGHAATLSEIADYYAHEVASTQSKDVNYDWISYYGDGDSCGLDELVEQGDISEQEADEIVSDLAFAYSEIGASVAANLATYALPDNGGGWLLVAHGVDWQGRTGYKLIDDPSEATSRSYDASFRFSTLNEDKGYAELVESSHDCLGSSVEMFSLTEDERERMENDMDFDEVIAWAKERANA